MEETRMRYNVHASRTFHHRITKYLGVLVGAALLVALGLPSAVQAQTTGTPMVEYDDDLDAFKVSRPHAIIENPDGANDSHWVLEVDGPVSVPDMVEADATGDLFTVQAKGTDGDWMFRLGSAIPLTGEDADGPDAGTTEGDSADEYKINNQGPWLSYMHGRPDAPEGFDYAMSGTTHLFTWESAIPTGQNVGVKSYWLRWTDGDPTLAATKWTAHGTDSNPIETDFYRLSSTQAKALKAGETYTFELTALGTSSSTTKVLTSAAASVMVPIGMVPTPTLPETAALLLALLLLGSGAYLLRGRQLTGLTRT